MRYARQMIVLLVLVLLTACHSKEKVAYEFIASVDPKQATDQLSDHQPIVVIRTRATEMQVLGRLAGALEELEALIREAEISADPDARLRFDYFQLRADLLAITQGIQSHIQTPIYAPRALDPIVGNYGR